jgi:exopolyphosphatase/guanosine-5'-triphosphate,3'-diphosphate pyrophosphatase
MAPESFATPAAVPAETDLAESEVLAAVDLGSNSFHMIVARFSHEQLTVIDRLREMVRLAAGLTDGNRLDDDSQARALECLSRFGERIRDIRAERVRVVGTNTLRKAKGSGAFLQQAGELLGQPVEIIAGIEEARLIYLGASHSLPLVDGPQLVVDIGGGSTEIIRGYGYEPELLESLYVGCVSLSTACFGSGKLSARRFERARLAARLELEPVQARFRRVKPVRCVGASGTIRAASNVLSAMGEPDGITRAGLDRLIATMTEAGRLDRLQLPGLSDQRAPVFPGGVAILAEVMAAVDVEHMIVSDGALREGILYDMVGRLTDEDARVRTVRSMEARFQVDSEQADRVEQTALMLLEAVGASWSLDHETCRLILVWAARLHEMGLDIAHAQYHRHGAYLLEHADMPGFTREEQAVLARLVGAHRRRFSADDFNILQKPWARRALRLTVLLRLAVLFNRSRTSVALPPIGCQAKGRRVCLTVPEAWLHSSPLTLADLELERGYLDGAGIALTLKPG